MRQEERYIIDTNSGDDSSGEFLGLKGNAYVWVMLPTIGMLGATTIFGVSLIHALSFAFPLTLFIFGLSLFLKRRPKRFLHDAFLDIFANEAGFNRSGEKIVALLKPQEGKDING